jgi:hypothetical protein
MVTKRIEQAGRQTGQDSSSRSLRVPQQPLEQICNSLVRLLGLACPASEAREIQIPLYSKSKNAGLPPSTSTNKNNFTSCTPLAPSDPSLQLKA